MNAIVTEAQKQAIVTESLLVQMPDTELKFKFEDKEIIIPVPAFRVGKFYSSTDDTGNVFISETATPRVRIDYYEARDISARVGMPLISNLQCLALAQNISQVADNWDSGVVGEGSLRMGLHKWSVNSVQRNDYVSTDPDERRDFVLSTGDHIYDVSGHIFTWCRADVEGEPETGLINRPFTADSPSILVPPYPSMTKGMGWRPTQDVDWSSSALVRGGYWYSDGGAGAFYLNFWYPEYRGGDIGFRSTK
jgi:hypothetical protein